MQPFPVPTLWITDALQFLVGGIMLMQSKLKELLHYDQDTGLFRWIKSPRYGISDNGIAGYINFGYIKIEISHITYKAHRLAWLYVFGYWPAGDVDHINGSRADNRISNLRVASRRMNNENQRVAQAKNKTGLLGVNSHGKRFKAQICFHGKKQHIGIYDTAQEAHEAYIKAKRELHEGCTI